MADTIDQVDATVVAAVEAAFERIGKVREAVGQVIFGQNEVIERTLATLLAGGHGLLVGVPGLAKTKLVETLSTVLGLTEARIQFTPDLMPSDILGSEVLDQGADGSRLFRFIRGPVFAQLIMADEINRASPRTQSALLQAMQEHHVTIAGVRYDLPEPFHVLATENPLEQEGTYPLPEAQLDRFLMQIDVAYPDRDTERAILIATTGVASATVEAVLKPGEMAALQQLVRLIPVGKQVVEAILDLVRAARPGAEGSRHAGDIAWGPGPRAAQSLMLAVKARAVIGGRFAPSLDDVAAFAAPVLKHRMAMSFEARARRVGVDTVIADLVGRIG
jgi:MoxR-like ATPase